MDEEEKRLAKVKSLRDSKVKRSAVPVPVQVQAQAAAPVADEAAAADAPSPAAEIAEVAAEPAAV
jgi:small subunit ribosomal protein S6